MQIRFRRIQSSRSEKQLTRIYMYDASKPVGALFGALCQSVTEAISIKDEQVFSSIRR
ncbi:11730_t:CDS:2 [Paraglomus brasilianum]|uniref:11730_t:CDS:1 n=1 Tax=Paraglomus brasilianum TaxID=144538 RepID=A0A9N9AUD2_9GLOM|nr:11730_t:CDS:2 [Paraglomus brasilianum]